MIKTLLSNELYIQCASAIIFLNQNRSKTIQPNNFRSKYSVGLKFPQSSRALFLWPFPSSLNCNASSVFRTKPIGARTHAKSTKGKSRNLLSKNTQLALCKPPEVRWRRRSSAGNRLSADDALVATLERFPAGDGRNGHGQSGGR